MSRIKVGDTLYGEDRLLRYKVNAIIDRGSNRQYEVTCQDCNHGDACTLLVTQDKHGVITYVGMVEDDDHYYFHTNQKYFLDKDAAYISRLKRTREWYEDGIRKHTEGIEKSKKSIAEIDEQISMHEEALIKLTMVTDLAKSDPEATSAAIKSASKALNHRKDE
jgi:hypothetical protein